MSEIKKYKTPGGSTIEVGHWNNHKDKREKQLDEAFRKQSEAVEKTTKKEEPKDD